MNPLTLIRGYLLKTGSTVPATLGSRPSDGQSIYGPDLPEGFDPANGCAITIAGRAGPGGHKEINPLTKHRLQLKVVGNVNGYVEARLAYSAARNWLHGAIGTVPGEGRILYCVEEVAGQDITDPDTGWATVVGFFDLEALEL